MVAMSLFGLVSDHGVTVLTVIGIEGILLAKLLKFPLKPLLKSPLKPPSKAWKDPFEA